MKDSRIKIPMFYGVVSIFLFTIQSVQLISIGTIYPDFILILTIIYALSRGSFKGELFGFTMGVLLDLMSGALFGLNAFILTFVGFGIDYFQKIAKLPNVIVFIFYIIVSTFIKYVLYHILFVIYEDIALLDLYFFLKIPGEILINILFGVILYIICSRFDLRDNYEWF